jgi:hypothetical protein
VVLIGVGFAVAARWGVVLRAFLRVFLNFRFFGSFWVFFVDRDLLVLVWENDLSILMRGGVLELVIGVNGGECSGAEKYIFLGFFFGVFFFGKNWKKNEHKWRFLVVVGGIG